jgi:hypothetical protein
MAKNEQLENIDRSSILGESSIFHPYIPELNTVFHENDNLIIVCRDKKDCEFTFIINDVICYRQCSERLMLSSLQTMKSQNVLNNFAISIENSDLLNWIKNESFDICEYMNLKHIRFLFVEEIIDVITIGNVEIKQVQNKSDGLR